ncbi:hypothetical protein BFJ72_g15410 [Fusarium proliferatum]|uniref:Uncharacterized protein n=2 Tax=cellular organisms TaxID=131567 RepID=A0A420R8L9_GIBIN|nr:hypothetical protein BFJ72_g15410 [Fusarium proliferatum]
MKPSTTGLAGILAAPPATETQQMAIEAIKSDEIFLFGSRHRPRGVIYEAELAELVGRKAIEQITVTVTPAGYWIAVLPSARAKFLTREKQKVVRIKPTEEKGFLVLHAVKRSQVRYYKSLDTFIRSVTNFGPLPKMLVRTGPPI